MASYLSNYLSSPRRISSRPVTPRYPGIGGGISSPRQNQMNTRPPEAAAPFAGMDLSSILLQNQQQKNVSTPSTTFEDTSNYDPIQAQIQALGAQSVANAKTNAAQLRNQAGITTGDPELLRSLGFDENTITASAGNPESLLAKLNTDYTARQKQLGEAEQAQNLYYSGDYQLNLGDLARGRASAQGGIGAKLRELLSGIDAGVLSSEEAARKAEEDAALQAAQQASYNSLAQQYQDLVNKMTNPVSGTTAPDVIDQPSLTDALAGSYNNPIPITGPGPLPDSTGLGNVFGAVDPTGAALGPSLVDPGFLTAESQPVSLGGGLYYDPSTGSVIQARPRNTRGLLTA